MDNRRDFLKKAILLSCAGGISSMLPDSVKRAAAINPEEGSTYLDAEHVVILMQENRSFDHCFGSLRGVRGFNDPRAITLPNNNKVWLQTNEIGETYVPFHFDIHNTKATWMGSTPHSRSDQMDANNDGKYDQWLQAKKVRNEKYRGMPLTLGYYTREDLPFHYAMADAFTICDQNFCSVMSSTDPNRMYFWSASIRKEQHQESVPHIRNDFPGLGKLEWSTFPEKLQDEGISWRVYQNDIEAGGGLPGRAWLGNFGCNPLEWFSNYNVKYGSRYIQTLRNQLENLPKEIEEQREQIKKLSEGNPRIKKLQTSIDKKQEVLEQAKEDLAKYNEETWEKLPQREKELFERAFTINDGDPDYHHLATLRYREGGEDRSLQVPKGDVLHQFRRDVEDGRLPTVSWLVAPWNLIDHPSTAWYGALYVSEVLDILTKNPEVWKKTIFIMTYDENDGYFDHIPPFKAPNPNNTDTGKCSPGINTGVEYISKEDELKNGISEKLAREGSIGLGYRVPMIIASPWSRGGKVCSEVFDHTSTLQFLEKFVNKKFGKKLREENISDWRRTVTGDLTSVFEKYDGTDARQLPFLEKKPFYESIYNAKFKPDPNDFRPLSKKEIAEINTNPFLSAAMPKQESGIRPSSALPYELYIKENFYKDKNCFGLTFVAGNNVFGDKSAGSPFNLYISERYAKSGKGLGQVGSRYYAVVAGGEVNDFWSINAFERNIYHLKAYGPNGFYREYKGDIKDPELSLSCEYEFKKGLVRKLTGNILFRLKNQSLSETYNVLITDNGYRNGLIRRVLHPKDDIFIVLNLAKSHHWYDFSIRVNGSEVFERRYAGRVETGDKGFTDPIMGNIDIV